MTLRLTKDLAVHRGIIFHYEMEGTDLVVVLLLFPTRCLVIPDGKETYDLLAELLRSPTQEKLERFNNRFV